MKMQYHIRELVSKSKFDEALKFFKENKHNYTNNEISLNNHLTSDILRCLRAIKSYSAAESYLHIYKIQINQNTSERIINSYILLLYDRYKNKTAKSTNTDTTSVLEKIITTLPFFEKINSDFAKSFYNTLALKIFKTESKRVSPNWKLIENFCAIINPNKLSTECKIVKTKIKGKVQHKELASVKEEWYAIYSKALYINNKFELCIKISEQALSEINKLHYSNEIWLSRRIAQSLTKLGNWETAQKKLEQLIKQKEEWFILFELAKIHIKIGNEDKASILLHKAILKPGDISFKVEILETLGDYYSEKGNDELAKEHYHLLIIIRTNKGWNVSPYLLKKAKLTTNDHNYELQSYKELLNKLRQKWLSVIKNNKITNTRVHGIIKSMARPKETGRDIFIKSESNKDYYAFVKHNNNIYNALTIGAKISFEVVKLPNKPMDKAVKIRVIN